MGKWQALQAAICDQQAVSGLTHNFYRYPARFAPSFARQAILTFSKPGDLVLDPFMGGGTTVVEASALGRQAVGTDISALSLFLAKAKSTPLSDEQLHALSDWGKRLLAKLSLRTPTVSQNAWRKYQKNINCRKTWRIRKLLEISLQHIGDLETDEERNFARCVLLRTGQWALDCREVIPNARDLRTRFMLFLEDMLSGARDFAASVRNQAFRATCLQRSAIGIELDPSWKHLGRPKLILTSPPYPGVHVLYHRWQVLGRRETPAPFWVAGALDGHGASFYTLGDRHGAELAEYYNQAEQAFKSISRICDPDTLLIQMIAFSDPYWQLPLYLKMLRRSGFAEVKFPRLATQSDGRAWRTVPNRKWYATVNGATPSSKEVVLFHRREGVA